MDIPNLPDSDAEKRLHLERYEYAASVLTGLRVLDCACGMGYGTAMLREVGIFAVGRDLDPNAIQLARQRFPASFFFIGDIHDAQMEHLDALVSFETLEHLEDPENVILKLPAGIKTILASVPIIPTVGINPAHRSDFTADSFWALIGSQFRLIYDRIQNGPDGKPLYLMLHGVRD
jgi:SAM-dependent methyltransferase